MSSATSRKSLRARKPTMAELKRQLNVVEDNMDILLNKVNAERDVDHKMIKETSYELRAQMNNYTDIFKTLEESLLSDGCTEEANQLEESRKIVKTFFKNGLDELKTRYNKDRTSMVSEWSLSSVSTLSIEKRHAEACAKVKSAQIDIEFANREAQLKVEAAEQKRRSLETEVELKRLQVEKRLVLANVELEALSAPRYDGLESLPCDDRVSAFLQDEAMHVEKSAEPVRYTINVPIDHLSAEHQPKNRPGQSRTISISDADAKPNLITMGRNNKPITFPNTPFVFTRPDAVANNHFSKKYEPIKNPSKSPIFTRPVDTESKYFPTEALYTKPSLQASVDPAVNFLARRELLQKSANPFNGEHHRFWTWFHTLQNRMSGVNLNALDVISILEANTEGPALKVLNTFSPGAGVDPENTLIRIVDELKFRFGKATYIANNLRKQFEEFPVIYGKSFGPALQELSDLCQLALLHQPSSSELQYLDTPEGQKVIRSKLPESLLNRWRRQGTAFEWSNGTNPPFSILCDFLREQAAIMNEPCYDVNHVSVPVKTTHNNFVKNPTKVLKSTTNSSKSLCAYHNKKGHTLRECHAFSSLSAKEKKKFVIDGKLCFKCLDGHFSKNCSLPISCDICNKNTHCTSLHMDKKSELSSSSRVEETPKKTLRSHIPNYTNESLNCGKTFLVKVTHRGRLDRSILAYAILDDQSSSSFISSELCKFFNISGPLIDYSLLTLGGLQSNEQGMVVDGFCIKGVKETETFPLKELIQCDNIPDAREESATPHFVKSHPHLRNYANHFNELNRDAPVALLIGRDAAHLHKTRSFGNQPPYAVETPIGWAVIGPSLSTFKNHMSVTKTFRTKVEYRGLPEVFTTRTDDELPGPSVEDIRFMEILSSGITVNKKGNIQMPLPFKTVDPIMPDNRLAVKRRMENTLSRIKKDPETLNEAVQFMSKIIDSGHIEEISDDDIPSKGKAWWIPIFPVKHPKKQKIRMVFDSSAKYQGTSLNAQLLQGLDQNNRLVGVLTRFRQGEVGFVTDIETMFHCFHLDPDHRNFLRFFWFKNNDPDKPLIEYRATVHIFGNRPSPAVAIYGLRHAVSDEDIDPATKSYVNDCFYMDDGLGSARNVQEAINILSNSRTALRRFNIHLHKICSSHPEVTAAFPETECADDVRLLQLEDSCWYRTLGISWNTKRDAFVIDVNIPDRPFTRRGILAIINSIFDPLGFVCPIVLRGRLIQRQVLLKPLATDGKNNEIEWDSLLPEEHFHSWIAWIESLKLLNNVHIPRSFYPIGFGELKHASLHIFCDASKDAIGYVIYVRLINCENAYHISFVRAGSKVAPYRANTIPRLELCAAVYAVISTREVVEDLDITIDREIYYTDSNVVLGYLRNSTRRFSRYVSNRVQIILNCSNANNWYYISSEENPADIATRPSDPMSLKHSKWFSGPNILFSTSYVPEKTEEINSIDLPEQERITSTYRTCQGHVRMFHTLFENLSHFERMVNVIKRILLLLDRILCKLRADRQPMEPLTVKNKAITLLIRDAQLSSFFDVYQQLSKEKNLNERHCLAPLNPFIADNGLLRVGGRLRRSDEPFEQRHPIIIPKTHKICDLIIRHYHENVHHQGRHVTLGAIVAAGFYIETARSRVAKYLNGCVLCKKLRGLTAYQRMADLPIERVTPSPPFTCTGMDVFGPFNITRGITTRRTKGRQKNWGLLFTCLACRAIHIEPLDSLDISHFKNAFRRFLSRWGQCKQIRSDRGTNFLGASRQELDPKAVTEIVEKMDCAWKFNPPHSSHYGGVWERKIASVKRILEGMLLKLGNPSLTRDEITTLWCECTAIVNGTPMWEISNNPDDIQPLTPAMLLTLKEPSHIETEEFSKEDLSSYGPRRWRRIQFLADHFWSRWRKEYLQTLQKRKKWLNPQRPLKSGDIVLLKDKTCRRNHWPIGKITSTDLTDDRFLRSASVRVALDGRITTLVRPIQELVPLIQEK